MTCSVRSRGGAACSSSANGAALSAQARGEGAWVCAVLCELSSLWALSVLRLQLLPQCAAKVVACASRAVLQMPCMSESKGPGPVEAAGWRAHLQAPPPVDACKLACAKGQAAAAHDLHTARKLR